MIKAKEIKEIEEEEDKEDKEIDEEQKKLDEKKEIGKKFITDAVDIMRMVVNSEDYKLV